MSWTITCNGSEIASEKTEITMAVNIISRAVLTVTDYFNMYSINFLDEIEIKQDDITRFKGIIVDIDETVEEKIPVYEICACDFLYNLKKDTAVGGVLDEASTLLSSLCTAVGITNSIYVQKSLYGQVPFAGSRLLEGDYLGDDTIDYLDIVYGFQNYDSISEFLKSEGYATSLDEVWVKVLDVEQGTSFSWSKSDLQAPQTPCNISIIAINCSALTVTVTEEGTPTATTGTIDNAHIGTAEVTVSSDITPVIEITGTTYDTGSDVEIYVRINEEITAKYSNYYSSEVYKLQMLQDLQNYFLFNYYVHHPTGELRQLEGTYNDSGLVELPTSYSKRTQDSIVNRVKISNYRGV
uniref:Uncharacterized protein n=1 Tax=Methanococcus maripaludis (strain C6 / ATCC BAA-1332) TaxID=444158 RepID=A9A7F4_METM6